MRIIVDSIPDAPGVEFEFEGCVVQDLSKRPGDDIANALGQLLTYCSRRVLEELIPKLRAGTSALED